MNNRMVGLAVAVAGILILPSTALAHHIDLHVVYTCGTFAVDADFTGAGAAGEPRRAVVKKDNVTVQTTDFTGKADIANFYTDSGSLPAAHAYEVKMYRKDAQGNFTILDDTDTASFNKQNTCSSSPTPTPTATATPTSSATPSATPSVTPSATPSATPAATATPTPNSTPTPTPASTPSPAATSTPTPAPVPPLINITVVPNPLALPAGPGPVSYTYKVTNEGTVAMDNVVVTDSRCAGVAFVMGDTDSDSNLDTNETWTYRCSATLSQTTTSTVTASDQTNGFTITDTATATVLVGAALPPPLIHVVTRPNVFVLPPGGGVVTYTYTVTNPGVEPLSDVTITDSACAGLPGLVVGNPGDVNGNNMLESNESWSFTCQTFISQTTTNAAIASGDANGLTATDSSPAIVSVLLAGLPSAGLTPEASNAPWAIAITVIIGLVATSMVVGFRKSSI